MRNKADKNKSELRHLETLIKLFGYERGYTYCMKEDKNIQD